MGSDHDVYQEGSFRIPAIYLNDWPDRYIHTNFDTPADIDPTKLKRAAFIGAASGYLLANLGPGDAEAVWSVVQAAALRRTGTMLLRRAELSPEEAGSLTRFQFAYERGVIASMERFFPLPPRLRQNAEAFVANLERSIGGSPAPTPPSTARGVVYQRNAQVKGPMSVFGYDYLADHFGADRTAKLALLQFTGLRGSGEEYAYEVLNFVDGRRSAQEIRDAVSAEYGPVPLEAVAEYLEALASTGVIKPRP
jgi:hypothetical protein